MRTHALMGAHTMFRRIAMRCVACEEFECRVQRGGEAGGNGVRSARGGWRGRNYRLYIYICNGGIAWRGRYIIEVAIYLIIRWDSKLTFAVPLISLSTYIVESLRLLLRVDDYLFANLSPLGSPRSFFLPRTSTSISISILLSLSLGKSASTLTTMVLLATCTILVVTTLKLSALGLTLKWMSRY